MWSGPELVVGQSWLYGCFKDTYVSGQHRIAHRRDGHLRGGRWQARVSLVKGGGRVPRSQLEASGTAGSCARGPGARGRTRRTCVCSRVGARGHAAPPGPRSSCQCSGAGSRSEGPSAQDVAQRGDGRQLQRRRDGGGSKDMERTPPNLLSRPRPNTGPRPSQGAVQPYRANAETTGAGGDPRGTVGDTRPFILQAGPPEAAWGLLMSSK
ncbi:unnamed protein product [Rangifer tarandus platyrhynchus]|uniref:Uncharacterized protein n=1 Tax=Rangifer tarandus platyrhynchus TaxID=3082113 RepID=A0AC59ZG32_RANTA